MNKITLVINTYNEEVNISDCINSAKSFVDEIIVCDMYSTDKTLSIAKELGAKIIMHEKTPVVEPARYFAISSASHPWVLVLDADERLTVKLGKKIAEIVEESKYDLIVYPYLYNYFGGYVYHGGFFESIYPRCFKKSQYLATYDSSDSLVHGNFRSLLTKTTNKIILGKEFFAYHEAYPSLEKYVQKTLGFYAKQEAEKNLALGESFSSLKLIYLPLKIFIGRYIFRKGFLDGWRGFFVCFLFSQFYFMTYANMWSLSKNSK